MFCASFSMQYLVCSSFAIIPLGKRELVAVYLQSCDCKCSVSLSTVWLVGLQYVIVYFLDS